MGFFRQLFQKKDKDQETLPHLPEVLDTAAAPLQGDIEDTVKTAGPIQQPAPEDASTVASSRSGAPGRRLAHPLLVGYASHVGRVRQRNEDSLLVLTSASQGEAALPPFGLFVVADGMGGHSEGQKASQLAVRTLARDVMSQIYPPFLQLDNSEPPRPIQDILSKSFHDANWLINGINKESGTTCTAALILGNRLFAAHVGDSRAYLIRDSKNPVECLSHDHSFVQRLQDAGQISADEAAIHPQRNILYRAVGQGEKLEIDTFSRQLPGPCWLLLCSDGLWGPVPAEFIQAVITSAASPQQACDELIEAALQAGGPDNITAIVIQYDPSGGS